MPAKLLASGVAAWAAIGAAATGMTPVAMASTGQVEIWAQSTWERYAQTPKADEEENNLRGDNESISRGSSWYSSSGDDADLADKAEADKTEADKDASTKALAPAEDDYFSARKTIKAQKKEEDNIKWEKITRVWDWENPDANQGDSQPDTNKE